MPDIPNIPDEMIEDHVAWHRKPRGLEPGASGLDTMVLASGPWRHGIEQTVRAIRRSISAFDIRVVKAPTSRCGTSRYNSDGAGGSEVPVTRAAPPRTAVAAASVTDTINAFGHWLAGEEIALVLHPAEKIHAHTVSTLVNEPASDDSRCVESVSLC